MCWLSMWLQPQIDQVNNNIRHVNQQLSRVHQQGELIRAEVAEQKQEINGKVALVLWWLSLSTQAVFIVIMINT